MLRPWCRPWGAEQLRFPIIGRLLRISPVIDQSPLLSVQVPQRLLRLIHPVPRLHSDRARSRCRRPPKWFVPALALALARTRKKKRNSRSRINRERRMRDGCSWSSAGYPRSTRTRTANSQESRTTSIPISRYLLWFRRHALWRLPTFLYVTRPLCPCIRLRIPVRWLAANIFIKWITYFSLGILRNT